MRISLFILILGCLVGGCTDDGRHEWDDREKEKATNEAVKRQKSAAYGEEAYTNGPHAAF